MKARNTIFLEYQIKCLGKTSIQDNDSNDEKVEESNIYTSKELDFVLKDKEGDKTRDRVLLIWNYGIAQYTHYLIKPV